MMLAMMTYLQAYQAALKARRKADLELGVVRDKLESLDKREDELRAMMIRLEREVSAARDEYEAAVNRGDE